MKSRKFSHNATQRTHTTHMIPATAATKSRKFSHNACSHIAQHMLGNSRNEIAEIFPQCHSTHIAQNSHDSGNRRNEIAEIFPQCMLTHSTTHMLGNSRNEIAEIFPQCHTVHSTAHTTHMIPATAATKSRKYSHVLPGC